MTDTSKEMLWHARQKHDKFNPSLPVTFCLADAQKMVPLSDQGGNFSDKTILPSARQEPASKYQENLQTFSLGQFDTIIDTFGLCSHEDPIAALKVRPHTISHLLSPNKSVIKQSVDQFPVSIVVS